jgi:hypothetical protein
MIPDFPPDLPYFLLALIAASALCLACYLLVQILGRVAALGREVDALNENAGIPPMIAELPGNVALLVKHSRDAADHLHAALELQRAAFLSGNRPNRLEPVEPQYESFTSLPPALYDLAHELSKDSTALSIGQLGTLQTCVNRIRAERRAAMRLHDQPAPKVTP